MEYWADWTDDVILGVARMLFSAVSLGDVLPELELCLNALYGRCGGADRRDSESRKRGARISLTFKASLFQI